MESLSDTAVGPQPLEFSVLDNDITILYKVGHNNRTPIRLILVRPRSPDEPLDEFSSNKFRYTPLLTRITELADRGATPLEIYNDITNFQQHMTDDDIGMTYLNYLQNQVPPPSPERQLELVNKFYEVLEPDVMQRYTDYDSLSANQQVWLQQVAQNFQIDQQRLQSIQQVQEELGGIGALELEDAETFQQYTELRPDVKHPVLLGPVTVNTTTLAYRPTLVSTGRPVVAADGLDIFNKAIPSRYVPYMLYNDEHNETIYRVYEGNSPINTPNFSQVTNLGIDVSKPSTVYMILWIGDPKDDGSVSIARATRDSFIVVIYNLEANYLAIKSAANEEYHKGAATTAQIIERLQNALPYVNITKGTEVNVTGEFVVWDIKLVDYILADIVLNYPTISVYFYMEENTKAWSQKHRTDLHFRSIFTDMTEGNTATEDSYISNYASISLILRQKKTSNAEMVKYIHPATGELVTIAVPAGTDYLQVNIYHAESRETVQSFLPIFRLMLRYYLTQEANIKSMYTSLIPLNNALPSLEQELTTKVIAGEGNLFEISKRTKIHKTGDDQIRYLKEAAPDLFIENSGRTSQRVFQPIVLQPEQVEQWRREQPQVRVVLDGIEQYVPRQVMPFPLERPRWIFACPSALAPYPGIKVNRMDNRDIYPVFPCCYKKDHMSPGLTSKYNKYLSGQLNTAVGAKADKIISTNKILTRGGIGTVAKAVKRVLANYSEDYQLIARLGMIYSPNSIFHVIATAKQLPGYMGLSADDAERYVIQQRLQMAAVTYPALVKQEMWDYKDEEIKQWLSDPSVFFDPALGYRALEEYFHINIYVFTPPTTEDEDDLGHLDIPRYQTFHAHPQRSNRPTVLIYKTWGSESNALKYPQCELIMDYNVDEESAVQLFDEEMTLLCHQTLEACMKTITWSVGPSGVSNSVNRYYYVNYMELLNNQEMGRRAVSQQLDPYGKLRSITIDSPQGRITIMTTIPGQPENIPVSEEVVAIDFDRLADLFDTPPSAVVRQTITTMARRRSGTELAWSEPEAVNNKMIVGAWYPILDNPHGLYVPVNRKLDLLPILPEGPPSPLTQGTRQITGLLQKLNHTHRLVVQIIRWLYQIYKMSVPEGPHRSAADFINSYLVFDSGVVTDSSTYYDFSGLQRRLPLASTVLDAINKLSPVIPSLLFQGHIIAYNSQYAKKLAAMINEYDQLQMGLPAKPSSYLDGFYESMNDFQIPRFTKLFLNHRQLMSWLSSQRIKQQQEKYSAVRTEIKISYSSEQNPYVFQDEQGLYYLIQNVDHGNRIFALQIAQYWHDHKINLGYTFHRNKVETIQEESILASAHMVYAISPNNTIVAARDNSGDYQRFLKVLYYGGPQALLTDMKGSYAAMLPLN